MFNPPFFTSDNKTLNEAFRIAVGDIAGNIIPYKGGILDVERPCLMAGLDYEQPWTRDTAINIWYALAMMDGEVCKNTLLSVLEERNGKTIIAGSYGQNWDNVIWAIGAREYLAFHDDPDFLSFAFGVITETLQRYETNSFFETLNLFSGQAVYGDGIAAYPDNIVEKLGRAPVYSLSLNCVYFEAYRICADFAKQLKLPYEAFEKKASAMKTAILKHFPNEKTGLFDYFVNESVAQEGLGLAYAILFDIADKQQSESFFTHAHITSHGIPCEWPPFSRYTELGESEYGRHCGTIWTLVNGAWALAAKKAKKYDFFEKELFSVSQKAVRDLNFYEIYHPDTGLPYGGVQEWEGKIVPWQSCRKQSWSATAFLAMLYKGIAGIDVNGNKLTVTPYLPEGLKNAVFKNINISEKIFTLRLTRQKGYPHSFESTKTELPNEIILSCL